MIFDELDTLENAKTRILVIGVGGAGKNALDHMIANDVSGVEFYAVNTDAQDLRECRANKKLLIGKNKTRGQGAGANPTVGRQAALESEDDIHQMIGDAQLVFITCGMGGGTGTGAAPVIARIAREHGCLTIGVCTKPFHFEGPNRMKNAEDGLEEISKYADTVIVIPNERLLSEVNYDTPVLEAFKEADTVLRKGVQGIAEIISIPGAINLHFSDIKTVMSNKGTALLGIGSAKGPNRAIEAARHAIHSRLLEVSIDGATDAVINITASANLGLKEVERAINEIKNNCSKNLNIIYGTAINSDLGDEMVITVVATGFDLKKKTDDITILADPIISGLESNDGIEIDITEDDTPMVDSDDLQKTRIEEAFPTGMSKKEEKRNKRIEEKLRKQNEKQKAKDERNKALSEKAMSESENKKNMPTWLKR